MYLRVPFVLLLLAQCASAKVTHPGSYSITKRFHHAALRRSAGLAADIRKAMGGVLVVRQQQQPATSTSVSTPQKRAVYCVTRPKSSTSSNNGNGTIVAHSSSRPSSTLKSTSTSKSSSGTVSTTGTATSTSGGATPSSSSSWKLVETHQGENFFNGWDFFTGDDPTHGTVQYVDQNTAQSNNLLEVNNAGNAIMRVETNPQVTSTRQSVRITTRSSFNGGLFIMDSVHMPTGCGTWPAFWTNGPNWPAGGEIDIVEGVNNYTNNQATIHTNPGCTIGSSSSTALDISGSIVGGTNCAAAETGNQGCGSRSPDSNSFGTGFNANGGGVYVMQWDNSGIAVYFFSRGSVPSDIDAGSPNPDGWGLPMARWPATTCNPWEFFNSHSIIFDTTLCGDWAGAVWTSSGIPGQEQSCADRTGFSTCQAFIQASGGSFREAYWEVSSVKVYQQS